MAAVLAAKSGDCEYTFSNRACALSSSPVSRRHRPRLYMAVVRAAGIGPASACSNRRIASPNRPSCAQAVPTITCAPAARYGSSHSAEPASTDITSGQRWVVKCRTPRTYAQIRSSATRSGSGVLTRRRCSASSSSTCSASPNSFSEIRCAALASQISV
ncbi:Uncharacterised protein [Mycobacteroides abscessus subsp. abscessus]|nr:Uncharacterised protein [Mycobacteroides abscessus subsp. abscessus]